MLNPDIIPSNAGMEIFKLVRNIPVYPLSEWYYKICENVGGVNATWLMLPSLALYVNNLHDLFIAAIRLRIGHISINGKYADQLYNNGKLVPIRKIIQFIEDNQLNEFDANLINSWNAYIKLHAWKANSMHKPVDNVRISKIMRSSFANDQLTMNERYKRLRCEFFTKTPTYGYILQGYDETKYLYHDTCKYHPVLRRLYYAIIVQVMPVKYVKILEFQMGHSLFNEFRITNKIDFLPSVLSEIVSDYVGWFDLDVLVL